MGIINTFFGALLGVWIGIVYIYIVETWLFYPLALSVTMTIFLLSRAIDPSTSEKFFYLGNAFYLSFLSSLIGEIARNPITSPQSFISLPRSWIFLFIVFMWWATSKLVNRIRGA